MAAIVLFLFGLKEFSREIQNVGGDALRAWLGRLTRRRWQGVVLGALATAIVQSSSAVTSLAVALVDAGTISFKSSLGILLGANVGTTSTAWLVSLKLTSIGPFFIVLGTVLSALPTRWKILGKTTFYAAAGLVITAVVQSSSITTGLAILLVQQGMLAATAAIPIVIGANIGTTSTGLLASLNMKKTARRTALANLVFNTIGVALFLPFLAQFSTAVVEHSGSPGMAVAWAHLIFNLVMTIVMLVLLNVFDAWIPQ